MLLPIHEKGIMQTTFSRWHLHLVCSPNSSLEHVFTCSCKQANKYTNTKIHKYTKTQRHNTQTPHTHIQTVGLIVDVGQCSILGVLLLFYHLKSVLTGSSFICLIGCLTSGSPLHGQCIPVTIIEK